MAPREQAEWVEDLRRRIVPPRSDVPAVCILDGGVVLNPLLQTALAPEDCLKYDPSWPLTDSEPHGTEMAGVALFGDQLARLLLSRDPVTIRHRLESVKVLPPSPQRNDPRLYGAITAQAVYRIESQAATRPRAFCMAITRTAEIKASRLRGLAKSTNFVLAWVTAIGDWFSFLPVMLTFNSIIVTPSPTTPIRFKTLPRHGMPLRLAHTPTAYSFRRNSSQTVGPLHEPVI